VQSTRLADPRETLISSLAQSTEELWHWKGNRQLLVLGRFQSTNISYPGSQSVKQENEVFLLLFHYQLSHRTEDVFNTKLVSLCK